MVEKIYDTIRAILYSEFPKNTQGNPCVYDREIDSWFFGDRKILPSALGVILRGTTSNIKDIGYGLREIEYNIGITIYSSNDDKEISERVIQEASRIAHKILKNHKTIWVCDLCPFCDEFPLNPIHYIDNGTITSVGIVTAILPNNLTSYTVSVQPTLFNAGIAATAYIRLSPGISGKITVSEILSCGLGIQATTYTDSNTSLSLTLSSGTPHIAIMTSYINTYINNVINQTNLFWQETHSTPNPPYYDWSGVTFLAINQLVSDWTAGIQSSGIWTNNFNNIVSNKVDLMRLLQNVQVSEIKPSDDGMEQAFMHMAEFTLKATEIISVDTFGPNNVNVNAV